VEVDVILLHRLSAVVDFLVFLSVFGDEFPADKGFCRLFVRQDAIQAVAIALIELGILFLDELLFGPVLAASH